MIVACATPASRRSATPAPGSAFALLPAAPLPAAPLPAPPRAPNLVVAEPEVTGPDRVVEIAVASVLTCARSSHGAVYCWGENRFDPQNTETCRWSWNDTDYRCHRRPTRVAIGRATRIAAGSEHVCAVLADSGEVACWGYNMMGTLGDGTSEMHVQPTLVSDLRDVRELALGSAHSCALDRHGAVWCWGANNSYAAGDPSGEDRTVPVRLDLDGVAHLAAGSYHTCALLGSGAVACWGDNGFAQLGDGTLLARAKPLEVAGLPPVVEIAAGHQNTCARTAAGEVWCWGVGTVADPGHELPGDRTGHPHLVAGVRGATQLALGMAQACAIVDGGLACWGYDRPLGRVAGLAEIVQVGSNWDNTCTLDVAGRVACWGSNARGQLGDGTTDDRVTPSEVMLRL